MNINLDTIVDWMVERGEFSYANRIQRLREQSQPGKVLDEQIHQMQEEAMEHYLDWMSNQSR